MPLGSLGDRMLPADKSTRDLLPPLQDDPEEIFEAAAEFGSPIAAGEAPLAAPAAAVRPADDPAPADEDHDSPVMVPIKALVPSAPAFHVTDVIGPEATAFPVTSGSWVQNFLVPRPLTLSVPRGASARDDHNEGQHRHSEDTSDGHSDSEGEIDEGNSIAVTQIAEVEQDATVIVHGYGGKVVARMHIDQDLKMLQGVEIDLTTDGYGHFAIRLDQYTRIDQEIDIDLEIFDVDCVLYVDLFLRDSIEIEQAMTLDALITDGPPGGTVEANQDTEMNQDVDIDLDIEDELEERYIVKVAIDVVQDADIDQVAAVDITYRDGDIDLDVDAAQTALVDQDTIVRIDFALA